MLKKKPLSHLFQPRKFRKKIEKTTRVVYFNTHTQIVKKSKFPKRRGMWWLYDKTLAEKRSNCDDISISHVFSRLITDLVISVYWVLDCCQVYRFILQWYVLKLLYRIHCSVHKLLLLSIPLMWRRECTCTYTRGVYGPSPLFSTFLQSLRSSSLLFFSLYWPLLCSLNFFLPFSLCALPV